MFQDEIKMLAEKITSGLATNEEIAQYNQYCNQFQAPAEWDETVLGNKQDIDQALRSRIAASIEQTASNKVRWIRRWFPAVAATLIIGLGAWIFRHELQNWLDPVQIQTIVTKGGESRNIILADGSSIRLGPKTELSYPEEFRGETREVKLTGEAFFDIAKDAAHPFIIRTDGMSTKVLGTSFNIKAYANDMQYLVTVVSGKVEVKMQAAGNGDSGKAIQLSPDERAIFSRKSGVLVKENFPDAARKLLTEQQGVFAFSGLGIAEVVMELERQFDTKIVLLGNYSDCAYYGNMKVSEGLEKFLQKLSLTINATIKQENNKWTIDVRGCR